VVKIAGQSHGLHPLPRRARLDSRGGGLYVSVAA
jgi:hypothetical protein